MDVKWRWRQLNWVKSNVFCQNNPIEVIEAQAWYFRKKNPALFEAPNYVKETHTFVSRNNNKNISGYVPLIVHYKFFTSMNYEI